MFKTVLKKLRNVTKKGPNIELNKIYFVIFQGSAPKGAPGWCQGPSQAPCKAQKVTLQTPTGFPKWSKGYQKGPKVAPNGAWKTPKSDPFICLQKSRARGENLRWFPPYLSKEQGKAGESPRCKKTSGLFRGLENEGINDAKRSAKRSQHGHKMSWNCFKCVPEAFRKHVFVKKVYLMKTSLFSMFFIHFPSIVASNCSPLAHKIQKSRSGQVSRKHV
jgi:hypothetical protein